MSTNRTPADQIKPGSDPRRHVAHSAETIAEVRQLRRDGWTMLAIADKYGMGLATVSKFCSDIPKPKKPTPASMREFDRKERRQQASDMQAGTLSEPIIVEERPLTPADYPDSLPDTADGFAADGIFPDDNLIDWAYQVQDRWLHDKARGRIFHGVPVDVIKAQIITATMLRPWDEQWMRDHRELWDSIRKFTTLNVASLAERVGISASSLTRYSGGTRTPAKGDFDLIRVAMWEAMQERLCQLDLHLCLEDYLAHLGDGGADVDAEDFTYDLDQALRWISGAGNSTEGDEAWNDEATLDHLPSLAHVRSLMPAPLYRDEDTILFGYLGFATGTDEDANAA